MWNNAIFCKKKLFSGYFPSNKILKLIISPVMKLVHFFLTVLRDFNSLESTLLNTIVFQRIAIENTLDKNSLKTHIKLPN